MICIISLWLCARIFQKIKLQLILVFLSKCIGSLQVRQSICTFALEYNADPPAESEWSVLVCRCAAASVPVDPVPSVRREWTDPRGGERGQRRNFNLPLQTHRAHRLFPTMETDETPPFTKKRVEEEQKRSHERTDYDEEVLIISRRA